MSQYKLRHGDQDPDVGRRGLVCPDWIYVELMTVHYPVHVKAKIKFDFPNYIDRHFTISSVLV